MICLRRFKDIGISRFRQALRNLKEGNDEDVESLVRDEELTEKITEDPVLKRRSFSNRREAGEYLYDVLANIDKELGSIDRDIGLWSWLSAVFIDEVAPKVDGTRKIYNHARYIPEVDNYQKYYRHLLAGPYQIHRAHEENLERAMVVLANPVHRPGEAVEQLSSRQEIVSNPNFLGAATFLYYDEENDGLKRGHAGKGGGSARRLAKDIYEQFDLTWDFYSMDPSEIVDLLPSEFDRFRNNG